MLSEPDDILSRDPRAKDFRLCFFSTQLTRRGVTRKEREKKEKEIDGKWRKFIIELGIPRKL